MRYIIELTRAQLVIAISILVVLGLTLFAGGFFTGLNQGSSIASPAPSSDVNTETPRPTPQQPVVETQAAPQEEQPRSSEESSPPSFVKEDSAPIPERERLVYELQLDLYHDEADARELVEELSDRGYEPFVVVVRSSEGVPRYTVRIGAFASLEDAKAAQTEFSRMEGELAVIRFRRY